MQFSSTPWQKSESKREEGVRITTFVRSRDRLFVTNKDGNALALKKNVAW